MPKKWFVIGTIFSMLFLYLSGLWWTVYARMFEWIGIFLSWFAKEFL
jgi:hypothetical protein